MIITHGGQAHRDDLLSIAAVLAYCTDHDVIKRRNPTAAELDNRNVWVLDVGGRHEPENNNYDHHQANLPCTIVLLNESLKLGLEFFEWYDFTNIFDTKGPRAAFKSIDRRPHPALISPVEKILIDVISSRVEIYRDEAITDTLLSIGNKLLSDAAEYIYLKKRLEKVPPSTQAPEYTNKIIGNVSVLIIKEEAIVLSAAYVRVSNDLARDMNADLIMAPCIDRETHKLSGGWTFFRTNDTSVDLSKLKGEFAHRGGFLAHTEPLSFEEAWSRICKYLS